MKILVDRLTASPIPFRFEGTRSWWEALGDVDPAGEIGFEGPIQFNLFAHRMGDDIYLEGSAEIDFEFGCSRCLARYRHAFREPFRIVLESVENRVPADPESAAALARYGMCLGDELEAGFYRGSEIDLSGYLREVVTLGLPAQPLCREDCRGLCPRCGADRNRDECSCEQVSPGSPFAVLGALRTGEGES